MDPGRKAVRVNIFNQTYTLAATDEPGEVEALAHTVDDLMIEIAKRSGTADTSRIAVLACMHMADRLRAIERELAALKSRVDEKSRQFSLLLDQAASNRS